jgi:hypothetical protein
MEHAPMSTAEPEEDRGFLAKALELTNSSAGSTRWLFEFYLICAICEALHLIAATIANSRR